MRFAELSRIVAVLSLLLLSAGLAQGQPGPGTRGGNAADTLMTIKGLYQDLASLASQEVKLLGFHTSPQSGKFYSSDLDYLNRKPAPAQSMVYLSGLEPDSLYWHGGMMAAIGTVSFAPRPTSTSASI